MGDTAGLTMGGSPQATIPLSPAPPDMSAAAGMGAQSLPASAPDSGGGDIGSLMKQLNIMPNAPTAPQFTSAPSPAMEPHVRVPFNRPMANNNRQPLSNQATSLKQARRQNRFAEITNVVNQYTQHAEQQKMADLKTDITNLTRAQSQVANAKIVLGDKEASPETKQAAQEVLKTNTDYINGLLKDPKKRKEISKAFDISFTDPSQNNTPEVKAGQAAIKDANAAQKQGLSANTPAEKVVDDHINKPKTPDYAEQFMSKQPQQLGANPIYEQQLKQFTDQQKYATQYIIPKIIDQQTKSMTAQILSDTKLQDRMLENKEKLFEQAMKDKSAGERAMIMADAHLRGIYSQNAERAQAAQLRAQTALQMAGLKDSKGTWKQQAFENQALMTFTNEIGKTVTANKSLQEQIDSIMTNSKIAGHKFPTDQEAAKINELKSDIKAGQSFISQMTDNRQKMTTKMYGTPVFPTTATPEGTKNGQPQSDFQPNFFSRRGANSATNAPNGPADDSAAAREAAIIDAKGDDWLTKANAFLDDEDSSEENLDPY